MKKKYKLKDGGTITAISNPDVVTKLRESSKFDHDISDEQFMYDFAFRYKVTTHIDIVFDNSDAFVSELIRTGYLMQID